MGAHGVRGSWVEKGAERRGEKCKKTNLHQGLAGGRKTFGRKRRAHAGVWGTRGGGWCVGGWVVVVGGGDRSRAEGSTVECGWDRLVRGKNWKEHWGLSFDAAHPAPHTRGVRARGCRSSQEG